MAFLSSQTEISKMKYSYLQKWVMEANLNGSVIRSLLRSRDGLCLEFSSLQGLFIVIHNQEALLFVSRKEILHQDIDPVNLKSSTETKVWPQLENGIIRNIEIAEADRIVYINIIGKDIYDNAKAFCLILEAMPPKPNIILARRELGKLIVLDAIHHYTLADNPQRQILPNQEYQAPQTSFSPDFEDIHYPLVYGDRSSFNNMNDLFVYHYQEKICKTSRANILEQMKKQVLKELKKNQNKQTKQKADLEQAMNFEHYHIIAETIKYNLDKINKGDERLKAINYFDPQTPEINIPLAKDKSPLQNMQAYLKKFHKAKNGLGKIEQVIIQTDKTIKELEAKLEALDRGEIPYLTRNKDVSKHHEKNSNASHDRLLHLVLPTGFEILIGRKATENDYITTKLGKPVDWWFHTRIYHGAHVLLRNPLKQDVPDELVRLCCELAAWYSKAKHSENVPVDYTQIRYVRKPRKSAPGFVIYTNHKTCFVDPKDIRQARHELGLKPCDEE